MFELIAAPCIIRNHPNATYFSSGDVARHEKRANPLKGFAIYDNGKYRVIGAPSCPYIFELRLASKM